MLLPRISIRKIFVCLVVLGSLLLLALNLRSKEWYSEYSSIMQISRQQQTNNAAHSNVYNNKNNNSTTVVENKTEQNIIVSTKLLDNDSLPWFFQNGKRWPVPALRNKNTGRRLAKLFPEEQAGSDRIINQLMFIPPDYDAKKVKRKKKILLYHSGFGSDVKRKEIFSECPVSTCKFTTREKFYEADAIVFKEQVPIRTSSSPMNQIWIQYFLESPYHSGSGGDKGQINWTATYRQDSDIVAAYGRWAYYNDKVKFNTNVNHNYKANKNKEVAWFVSNCNSRNGRLQYAQELQKYISVDIYGHCGKHVCPRGVSEECFKLLKNEYKYYLAFENSNCKDYITEKVFLNALSHDIIPIVMGAHPSDYENVLPYHSYIHVSEFKSPKELAEYLHRLSTNDTLYNRYFEWKNTGELINTYFWCRVCAMLHDDVGIQKMYLNFTEWWHGANVCGYK